MSQLPAAGADIDRYVTIEPLDPLYRATFADGSVLRVRRDRADMVEEIRDFSGGRDAAAFGAVVEAMAGPARGADLVVGVEARGFLLGAAVALAAGIGVVPVRKAGKLPVVAASGMTAEQRDRYSRHTLLPEVGVDGQLKLLDSKVLLLGAGGLGAPTALYLAAAGVGGVHRPGQLRAADRRPGPPGERGHRPGGDVLPQARPAAAVLGPAPGRG